MHKFEKNPKKKYFCIHLKTNKHDRSPGEARECFREADVPHLRVEGFGWGPVEQQLLVLLSTTIQILNYYLSIK